MNQIVPPFIKNTIFHVAFWCLFITYEVAIIVYLDTELSLWQFIGVYSLNIGLFYFNAYFLFNQVHRKGSKTANICLLVLWLVAELAIYCVLRLSLTHFIYAWEGHPVEFASQLRVVKGIWRGVYFIGISLGFWLILEKIRTTRKAHLLEIQRLLSEKERAQLESRMIKVKNDFLKAQINPHLLHNTLSFIYRQIDDIVPDAAESVSLLSEIMAYSLDGVDDEGKVALEGEITQIKNYIQLNRILAHSGKQKIFLQTRIEKVEENKYLKAPPLILLTFIENVFQHGKLSDPDYPACIHLSIDGGVLHLHTENLKKSVWKRSGHHIGTENAKERLRNYYGKDDFSMEFSDKDDTFVFDLKIKL